MTFRVKDPSRLEKELKSILGRSNNENFPVAVVDTGGIIDLVKSCREYDLSTKRLGERVREYTDPTEMLKKLRRKMPTIITPETRRELVRHKSIMLNSKQPEIYSHLLDYAFDLAIESAYFVSGLKPILQSDNLTWDDVGYEMYWLSKECCNGNKKKNSEGCSPTDREILTIATYLSRSGEGISLGRKITPVIVISPDQHITCGIDLINKDRELSDKYPGIVSFSTRYKK